MPSEKLVKDFMRSLDRYSYIKEDATVQEALLLIDKTRKEGKHLCLVVVGKEPGEKEIIKGFVKPADLVLGLTTRFLKGAKKSGPIFWEGQFESECLDGMNKRVREIMAPVRAYIGKSKMLMEAVFLLNKYQEDFLPATSKEEVVGIIHIHEISAYIAELASGVQGRSKKGSKAC
ncbi:MAG: hypothetical protein SRB1_00878 [Desulfobacteraceae bacterium Eth-SRB1]|nr:MAG: hypothetical protein SRB1_00878 [Desulfobacteraceae bacterium Eth-SRB1]